MSLIGWVCRTDQGAASRSCGQCWASWPKRLCCLLGMALPEVDYLRPHRQSPELGEKVGPAGRRGCRGGMLDYPTGATSRPVGPCRSGLQLRLQADLARVFGEHIDGVLWAF
jgi:hypothetical protein